MKLYYSEYLLPDFLQSVFFPEAAKFIVKEKEKANFHLLMDYTSTLLVIFNGKTKKLSAKIAGYRDVKINLNLPENSFVHLLKFKPEMFYLLNAGKIEKYKNKLIAFPEMEFNPVEQSDEQIIKTVLDFFSKINPDFGPLKKYLTDSINTLISKNGIYKIEELVENSVVSIRQFQREFKKVTGFSPKEFSSIVRINSLTSELVKENVSLRDIFFDFGFYDQAHFNKEFKKIVGANPSLFESRQKVIKYLLLQK